MYLPIKQTVKNINMKKKTRTVLWFLASVLAAAVLVTAYFKGRASKTPQLSFETVTVAKSDISSAVTATGTIEPVTEVEVGTQVSGIIDRIFVDYNSIVKEGQIIAEMDKVTLESELASARAAYDGSKAEYDYQSRNYERNRALHEKSLISDTDYEQSLYNYEMARSSFHSSEAALAKAERNLSYATITSPIDGVVIDRAVEEGQTVAAGFETPTLFTIAADLTRMQVVADVDEADIGGVADGQRVTFTVDAYPDDVFEGKVTQIRLGSSESSSTGTSTTESVVTYEVVISADNPELKLKPRLTANISIYTIDRPGVLCVPAKALRFTPQAPLVGEDAVIVDCNAGSKVWTRSGNTFTAHAVTTGITNGIMTEILGGIDEGTEIVTGIEFGMPSKGMKPASGERSPFMPGPPGENKDKNGKKGR